MILLWCVLVVSLAVSFLLFAFAVIAVVSMGGADLVLPSLWFAIGAAGAAVAAAMAIRRRSA